MGRLLDGVVFVVGWSLHLTIYPAYCVVHMVNAPSAQRFEERLVTAYQQAG